MNVIKDLMETLKDEKYIFIQTHNFPDHDAVASAYGLQVLFKEFGIISYLTYDGEIQRDSLINMDTALLTRGVIEKDIEAYSNLYVNANVRLVNSILRNYIQVKDLEFYKRFINKLKVKSNIAFCYFDEGCNQNMLGILGDFCLSLKEVAFVILCAKNEGKINFSLRSESSEWNCGLIIQDVLKNIGFGGGHDDMAGSIFVDLSNSSTSCHLIRRHW